MSDLSVKDRSAMNTKVLYEFTLPLLQKLNAGTHSSNILDILNTCLRHYNGSSAPSYNVFCSLPRPSIRSVEDIDPEMVWQMKVISAVNKYIYIYIYGGL